MPGSLHISAYAAVSEDGMLANAAHVMPDTLKLEADQRFFQRGCEAADVLVHGRHSQEPFATTADKPRLILTQRTSVLEPPAANPKALLWNPAIVSFERALEKLAAAGNHVVIIGATAAFDMFLGRYDAFYLSRVAGVRLPGGTPVFKAVPAQTPEAVLSGHGLVRGGDEVVTDKLVITRWERRAPLPQRQS